MVDLRTSPLERPPQGRDCQLLLQAAAQVPAPDATRENVHDHRQIDELLSQTNISEVRNPDLLGTLHLQALNQVRVPGEWVVAVGRPRPPLPGFARDPQLVHLPPDRVRPVKCIWKAA